MTVGLIILAAIVIFVLSGIKVVNQYQRGVVLTLGKFSGVREPGLRIVLPVIQTMTLVDIRSTPIDVPKQEVITRDNVTVGVDAVVYFRVVNAPKAVLETTNYIYATSLNADGEKAAAETLAQAAEILAKTPGAINLRTLNTLERISTEPSQKTMMLFPVELIDALRGGKK